MRLFVGAKLHGIRVTQAELNYRGSITLDPIQCRQAGILPLEFVNIWNKNNGSRITTYVIYGAPGSRCCIANGAAARTCQIGDEIIVATQILANAADITAIKPKVLTYRDDNHVDEILTYSVEQQDDWYSFDIGGLTDQEKLPPITGSNPLDLDRIRHELRAEGLNEQAIDGFCARHLTGKAA